VLYRYVAVIDISVTLLAVFRDNMLHYVPLYQYMDNRCRICFETVTTSFICNGTTLFETIVTGVGFLCLFLLIFNDLAVIILQCLVLVLCTINSALDLFFGLPAGNAIVVVM